MQRRAIGVIKPITGIERKQFQLGAVWEVGRLVHDKPASGDPGLNGHSS